MLVLKTILCILSLIAFWGARKEFWKHNTTTRKSLILAIIAAVLGFIFCVLQVTNNNMYFIVKIFFFFSACCFVLFKDKGFPCKSFEVFFGMALLSAFLLFRSDFKETSPEITVTTYNILSVKNSSSSNANISGFATFIKGSLSEESVYKYYYQTEDGGFKQGSIPVDSTTIYFIDSSKNAYLEKVVASYSLVNNTFTHTFTWPLDSKETYNLYIPKGSILNTYEFNAE